MHSLTSWFIRNPVAANLLMALILFLGGMTLVSMRIEGFPRIPAESVQISTTYANATAQQVSELVTHRIEQSLEGLEGVKEIRSQSSQGFSFVSVRRAGGQDLQKLLDKVRLRIDAISDLPSEARSPVIEASGFDFPALYVNLYGYTDPATLQTLARRLKEELLAKPELSRLKIWGIVPQELHIEVEPEKLRQLNVTTTNIVDAIQSNSLNFQAGSLRTSGGNILLRADDRARYVSDFENIPVIEREGGSRVLLGDIAHISDAFVEGDFLFRLNGKNTVGMEVLIGQKENLLKVADVVSRTVADFTPQLPPNVNITVWGNSSNYISDRLALLRSNGVQGLALVALILSIFLNVRLAFWVAMGIPISVLGAIAVAGSKWVDYSLNDVTTFGLIIALGILVDDAVVVGESVFEERGKTKDPIKGTEAGVQKVATATVFGVLTTIAAFFPMLLIDNPLGKVLAGFSGVVILALVFSLIESKFILPAHLAHIRIGEPGKSLPARMWSKVQSIAQFALFWFRDNIYYPMLVAAVHHRYAALVMFISAAVLGLGLVANGKIKLVFFPDVPGQVITINLKMDARAPFTLTRDNVAHIEKIGDELNDEYKVQYELDEVPIRTTFVLISSANEAQIFAELSPVAERPGVKILDMLREWRKRVGQVEGAVELQFSGAEELGGGFRLDLRSKDAQLLGIASKELREYLGNIEGVSNVRDSLQGGQPELRLRVRQEARSLGFTAQTLATQIGQNFGGAHVQRILREGNEVKVLVQNAKTARDTIDDLLKSELRSTNGQWVPLTTVATIEGSYVSGSVSRTNAKLSNTVAASIDRSIVSPSEVGQAVSRDIIKVFAKKYPSVTVSSGGELEEMGEIQDGLVRALLIASVLIYVLLAVPLKSYWQPLVILAIVPFGFVGAAVGHFIVGISLSLFSFFGMLALTGVVVNDSLVLITRYNQARESGKDVSQSLKDAGIGRFQAIFLTTATTVVGLLPLLAETSEQAQYLIPAAVSLAYGEIFGTALMLILVPVLLAISEDFKRIISGSGKTI